MPVKKTQKHTKPENRIGKTFKKIFDLQPVTKFKPYKQNRTQRKKKPAKKQTQKKIIKPQNNTLIQNIPSVTSLPVITLQETIDTLSKITSNKNNKKVLDVPKKPKNIIEEKVLVNIKHKI